MIGSQVKKNCLSCWDITKHNTTKHNNFSGDWNAANGRKAHSESLWKLLEVINSNSFSRKKQFKKCVSLTFIY